MAGCLGLYFPCTPGTEKIATDAVNINKLMKIPFSRSYGSIPGQLEFNTLHLPFSIATWPSWLVGSMLLVQEHQGQWARAQAMQLSPVLVCSEPGLHDTLALGVAAGITYFFHKPFPKCQRCQARTGLLHTTQEKADLQTTGGAGKTPVWTVQRGGTKPMCSRWLPHAAQSKTDILPFLFYF